MCVCVVWGIGDIMQVVYITMQYTDFHESELHHLMTKCIFAYINASSGIFVIVTVTLYSCGDLWES